VRVNFGGLPLPMVTHLHGGTRAPSAFPVMQGGRVPRSLPAPASTLPATTTTLPPRPP
jgi:hypothetical protein